MDHNYDDQHVLIIGSAGIDVKGRPDYTVTAGTSTPGRIRSSVGGVARNIAENLARLEVPTILLSAVGDDGAGQRVLDRCQAAKINTSHVLVVPEARTGHYIALLAPDGQLDIAVSDYAIASEINADYLDSHKDLFPDAAMIVIDANLENSAIKKLFQLAHRYKVPVCADPTAPDLAPRLRPYLNRINLITPNLAEASVLCGETVPVRDIEMAHGAAQMLLEQGVPVVVVTLGVNGLVYVSGSDRGHIPAMITDIVDETGAGDALTAGVIFGLLNEVPLDEAMRLGVTAASLTLQSRETVVKDLTQELLYDRLVV